MERLQLLMVYAFETQMHSRNQLVLYYLSHYYQYFRDI